MSKMFFTACMAAAVAFGVIGSPIDNAPQNHANRQFVVVQDQDKIIPPPAQAKESNSFPRGARPTPFPKIVAAIKSGKCGAEWMKAYLLRCMMAAGVDKVAGELFKLRIQKNSRPSIQLADGADIPEQFKRVKVEFDNSAAYEAWKAGEELSTCVGKEVTNDTLSPGISTIERSSHWPHVRDQVIQARGGKCELSGAATDLEAHHVIPFHFCVALGRGFLELDPRNLIVLSRGPVDFHLLLGHLDNFTSFNLKGTRHEALRHARHRERDQGG